MPSKMHTHTPIFLISNFTLAVISKQHPSKGNKHFITPFSVAVYPAIHLWHYMPLTSPAGKPAAPLQKVQNIHKALAEQAMHLKMLITSVFPSFEPLHLG